MDEEHRYEFFMGAEVTVKLRDENHRIVEADGTIVALENGRFKIKLSTGETITRPEAAFKKQLKDPVRKELGEEPPKVIFKDKQKQEECDLFFGEKAFIKSMGTILRGYPYYIVNMTQDYYDQMKEGIVWCPKERKGMMQAKFSNIDILRDVKKDSIIFHVSPDFTGEKNIAGISIVTSERARDLDIEQEGITISGDYNPEGIAVDCQYTNLYINVDIKPEWKKNAAKGKGTPFTEKGHFKEVFITKTDFEFAREILKARFAILFRDWENFSLLRYYPEMVLALMAADPEFSYNSLHIHNKAAKKQTLVTEMLNDPKVDARLKAILNIYMNQPLATVESELQKYNVL